MNLSNLTDVAISIALSAALMGNLDKLQTLVWKAQAKLLYESRTATWGSPNFFKNELNANKTNNSTKGGTKYAHKTEQN